jgi:hypothetical protein
MIVYINMKMTVTAVCVCVCVLCAVYWCVLLVMAINKYHNISLVTVANVYASLAKMTQKP